MEYYRVLKIEDPTFASIEVIYNNQLEGLDAAYTAAQAGSKPSILGAAHCYFRGKVSDDGICYEGTLLFPTAIEIFDIKLPIYDVEFNYEIDQTDWEQVHSGDEYIIQQADLIAGTYNVGGVTLSLPPQTVTRTWTTGSATTPPSYTIRVDGTGDTYTIGNSTTTTNTITINPAFNTATAMMPFGNVYVYEEGKGWVATNLSGYITK